MGIIGRIVPCNEKGEKHDWVTSPGSKRKSGYNWRQVWRCRKCGATSSNDERVKNT
jgi:rubrerythrin